MKKVNTAKGFTLIELVMVIAIIGITSVTAVVNFTDMFNKFKLTEQTEKIATQIRYVRDYASSREKVCVIVINSEDASIITKTGNYSSDEITDEDLVTDLILPGELSSTTTLSNPLTLTYSGHNIDYLENGENKILFDGEKADGTPVGGGEIKVQLNDINKRMRINDIGKVFVFKQILNDLDILGCTDSEAMNFDRNATIDDGSCEYYN